MMKRSHHIDQHIGARIRRRRQALGMSQTRLGNALGLSYQQVQKYEDGVDRVSASRLHQLAHILRVRAPFFFDGLALASSDNGSELSRRAAGLGATRDGLVLTRYFMRIRDVALRRLIVQLIERFAEP